MHRSIAIIIGILIVLILVGFNTTYSVNFHEVAIKTRFGKPVEVVREPGLHFKAPFFIDRITKLDTRFTVLGHLQRGGGPNTEDKILANRFAFQAVNLLAKGEYGKLVVLRGGAIKTMAYADMTPEQRWQVPLDSDLVRVAEGLGVTLGR